MSSEIAVSIENVSKCYHIYDQPRDRLKQFFMPTLRRAFRFPERQYFREFWALSGVSLEIRKGEAVGIIGRNGSGKSTLLQVICGTLNPTSGSVKSEGRVAALLELGSGFNPEFTGRENVYLNAGLYGLSVQEIDRRFSDIEKFADIGAFIDQPVKTYSSGMYVRLAFAVIAHVDADILVIDEALAVGDIVFTQKCMRFLRAFKETRTLLFVSHDTSAVMSLCEKSVWLHEGKVRQVGAPKEVAEEYLQFSFEEAYGNEVPMSSIQPGSQTIEENAQELGSGATNFESQENAGDGLVAKSNLSGSKGWRTEGGEIREVKLESSGSTANKVFQGGEPVKLQICATVNKSMMSPILGFVVRDRLGQELFGENTLVYTQQYPSPAKANTEIEATFSFDLPMLPNGQYVVTAALAEGDYHDHVHHHFLHDALVINVSSSKARYGLVGIPFHDVELRCGL